MTRQEKILSVVVAIFFAIALAGIWSVPAHGQELSPVISVDKAKPGDVVKREKNIEVTKDKKQDTYTARIYAAPQFDAEGEPLLKSPVDGTVWRGDYYVRYVPDEATGRLRKKVMRANAEYKEDIILTGGKVTKLSWRVESNAGITFTNNELVFADVKGNFLFRSPAPVAWDANKKNVGIKPSFDGINLTYDLTLDKVTFPVTVDPTTVAQNDTSAGQEMSSTASGIDAARNSATYTNKTATRLSLWSVFQVDPSFQVGRSSLQFNTGAIPDGSTIDSGAVKIVVSDAGTNPDGMRADLLVANFTGSIDSGWFNDFYGWAESGAYSAGLVRAATTISLGASAGDTLTFTLNAAGCDSVNWAGYTKYMLVSSRDISNTTPTGTNYQFYENTSAYLTVTYTVPPPATQPRSILYNNTGQVLWDKTFVPLWQP